MKGPFSFTGTFEVHDGEGRRIAKTEASLHQLGQAELVAVQEVIHGLEGKLVEAAKAKVKPQAPK